MRKALITLLFLPLLLGCYARSGGIPLFNSYGYNYTPGSVVVQKGDTLYSLSRKYQVPLRGLIEENNLSAPYALNIGQNLRLPKRQKHVVSKLKAIGTMLTLFAIKTNMVFAAEGGTTIGTAEVTQATDNIKRVITSIAMPLGGVLIFASVVVAAIKMIANSNNPQKRAESIGSLAWICGGGVVLGASLIIAGIIVNVATNNTGGLLGG